MVVGISSELLDRLIAEAARAHPHEACGLLYGTGERIDDAEIVANVAADPARGFEIDPAALFAALRAERAGGARLIGYWHSHPTGDATPSATDTAMAAADGKLWLIIAGERATLWRAGDHGFEAATLDPDR